MMSQRSRVSVDDFVPTQPLEFERAQITEQFGPRLHHCAAKMQPVENGRAIKVSELRGRKFHVGRGPTAPGAGTMIEVIPAGVTLTGKVRFSNATEVEIGGLAFACAARQDWFLKVGAGKGLGFGRLRGGFRQPVARDHARRVVEVDLGRCVEHFLESDDHWRAGLDALMKIHHGGC
jgi:hypothetical protein